MGVQSSSQVSPQHSASSSHSSGIHFPHQPSNPIMTTFSSSSQFQLNNQSLSILSRQQIVQSNYQQQFDQLFSNFRPQSKLIYGKVRILCSKITNQKIHQYRMVFRNQQQMRVYLMSYYWRKAIGINDAQFPLVRTVNFKLSQDSKNSLRGGLGGFFTKSCSNSKEILCRVYIEDIPLRLCHIKDIPFPENLYVLKQSLRGFQIIYQNIGYIRPLEDLICIGRKGQVKVWINSDLSKNFPNVQNMQSNFTQINSQSKLINEIIQLVNTNTDSQGQPCPITMYMKQYHVNMQHITFEKIFEMLARYCIQYSIQIPQLFSSIVQALNQQQQQYDTYRTQMEFQQQRGSSMLKNNSVNCSIISGSGVNELGLKQKISGNSKRRRKESNSNNNIQSGNMLNINNSGSNRNMKKRPTHHVKCKTQSLHDTHPEQQSSSSSLINNDRVKSNIVLSYSMPLQSKLSYNEVSGDSVVQGSGNNHGYVVGNESVKHQEQERKYYIGNNNISEQSSNRRLKRNSLLVNAMGVSNGHEIQVLSSDVSNNKNSNVIINQQSNNNNQYNQHQVQNQFDTIQQKHYDLTRHEHYDLTHKEHNFLSTNQLSNYPNTEYNRNKKTYSNFWQRSKAAAMTLMPQQQSSLSSQRQHNANYITASKQQYEQMLRIDKYIQAQVLEEEYQQDKLKSIQSSQCKSSSNNNQHIKSSQCKSSSNYQPNSNNDYYYSHHQRVYSNNYYVRDIQQQQGQQEQEKDFILCQQQQYLHSNQIDKKPQRQVQLSVHNQLQIENSKKPSNNMPISSSSQSSQQMSPLPDLQQQSNRKVIVKESVSINETSMKNINGNVVDMTITKPVAQQHITQPICYNDVPQLPSPFKQSSHDSFLPSSQINIQTSNQSLTSNNHLSPENIIYNNFNNNMSTNNMPSQQITSHQTQSQFIVSNTSIEHSVQGGGVYQNLIIAHHPMNHSVSQYVSGHSYQAFNRNTQPFFMQSFKSAQFSSYDPTFGNNNNKLSSPNSPIIPKITFTIHSPEVYSTSSQHHTTSLQQSLVQTNTLQYSQQYNQPQDTVNLEPNLTGSNANYKHPEQPNFKRLAHRANTVKSHYMNSQENQISSRRYCELGQNQSLQSKPSIVQYSLLRNPEMFKIKKQQQNILIHQTLEETNSFQKLKIDKPPIQQNKMDLMNQLSQQSSEKKVSESVEMFLQQQLNGGKQIIQQKQQDSHTHSYPHNQSEPQLRHLYYQKGSQMVPIPEDVMAQTINNSRSLLMINNCEESINMKAIHGQKKSSNDSNTSQILKSHHQNYLSDFGNEVLLHSYEYQPQQQLANSYHKKLQQLEVQCTKKQQQHSYFDQFINKQVDLQKNNKKSRTFCIYNEIQSQQKQHIYPLQSLKSSKNKNSFNLNHNLDSQTMKNSENNKVNFDLNANFYTDENIIMDHQFSKIEQSKSHQINLNGIHISKPSFQSIQSSQIPSRQGFSSKQLSLNDRQQSSSKKSQRKLHYLKLIATKSISGSRVEEQGHQGRNIYKFAESIEQNSANSVYQFAMDDDVLEKKVGIEVNQFMKEKSPSEQKDISQESQKLSSRGLNNGNQFNRQFVDHESSISSQMDYAYKSYEKWKEKWKEGKFQQEGHKEQSNQQENQKYLFLKKNNNLPLNQYNQRHSNYKKLVKSSIQGINLPTNYYLNNTQQKRQSNRLINAQNYCNEFGVSFQKNLSHSNFMKVGNQYKEDEIDEQILNDLKNI